jgi:hypothetical protein
MSTMRLELVFFAPEQLVLDALCTLLKRDMMCVRNAIEFEFVCVDLVEEFVLYHEADVMLSQVNSESGSCLGPELVAAFPGVINTVRDTCMQLKIRVTEDGCTPRGFTICVPTGVASCPNLFVYGASQTPDVIYDAFTSFAKLLTEDCRIAVPCHGNVLGGATSMRASVDSMVAALEHMPALCS